MLRQMCRRGRLTAYLDSNPLNATPSTDDNALFVPDAKHNGGLEVVPLDVYNKILDCLNSGLPSHVSAYRHAQDLPHPLKANVLPRFAWPIHRIQHKGRSYSIVNLHGGNSSIFFSPTTETAPDLGHIEAMWRYDLSNAGFQESRTFIVLSLHESLSAEDTQRNPYRSKPGFLANIMYARDPAKALHLTIIEQAAIISHVAYYCRPARTFGIQKATTVFVNSLHRYRD